MARLRAPGQGLDLVAVAAESQPETVWGVPQLHPREQPFDQVRPPCPGAAQEPWCRQGHQQWGWGRQPAAHTGDH